jgi:hypothetical protein
MCSLKPIIVEHKLHRNSDVITEKTDLRLISKPKRYKGSLELIMLEYHEMHITASTQLLSQKD